MATTIKLRRGTAAQWNAANPVLAEGEVGIELQAGVVPEKAKLGDGVTAWNALPYSVPTDLAAEEAARIAADNAHAATPHGPAPHPDLAAHDTLGLVTQAELDVEIAQLSGTYVTFLQLAYDPEPIIGGTITRDANEAVTSAPVIWPDGAVGTFTATVLSSAFLGAIDAYTVTYGSPVTRTYTQPTMTRDASGAVTVRPAIVVT